MDWDSAMDCSTTLMCLGVSRSARSADQLANKHPRSLRTTERATLESPPAAATANAAAMATEDDWSRSRYEAGSPDDMAKWLEFEECHPPQRTTPLPPYSLINTTTPLNLKLVDTTPFHPGNKAFNHKKALRFQSPRGIVLNPAPSMQAEEVVVP